MPPATRTRDVPADSRPPARPSARLRAVSYSRVSTLGQVDGTSLDGQCETCDADIARRGWEMVAEPYIDAGVSGAKASRPALDRLMQAARRGEFDVIVISKLDRFGRSLLDLLQLMQELDGLGVRIVSVSDGIDTSTPTGRLMTQLLGIFAEFERNRIRERSDEGLLRRAQEGGFVSSTPPFGYTAVPDPRGRGVQLAVDDNAAACIRAMFTLLVEERRTIRATCARLNAAGHLSASGIPWTPATLARWARGTAPQTAAGTWTWRDVTVPIPPILTPDQAAAWAFWLTETTVAQTSNGAYLLSGLVHTPCGRRYHGRTAGRQAPTYSCRAHLTTSSGSAARCGCFNISVEALDEAVWNEVRAVLTTPHALATLTGGAAAAGPGDDLGRRLAQVSKSVADLQAQIATDYADAVADGFDTVTARLMVKPRKDQLAAARAEMARIGKARAAAGRIKPAGARVRDAVVSAAEAVDRLDSPGRREVLEALGVEVHVEGYERCAACNGTGYPPQTGRRRRARPVGADRLVAAHCGRCRRMRMLPVVKVSVLAPNALG